MNKEIFDIVRSAGLLPNKEELFDQLTGKKEQKNFTAELYQSILNEIEQNYFYDCDDLAQLNITDIQEFDPMKIIKDKLLKVLPTLSLLLKNIHPSGKSQVLAASILLGDEISFNNITELKLLIRKLYDDRWTRDQSDNEKQGGVSVLGSISEELLNAAIESLTEHPDIFRTHQDDIKSYGDFVLMALPNNLWFSVKSGYSRERLLASGFFNDLVGVGFFEDFKEFTTLSKVRNFKKVGFLAIYLPDTPVTEEQNLEKTSTYEQVISYYETSSALPLNLNGKTFFRPLSELGNDINSLLELEISKRTTINF